MPTPSDFPAKGKVLSATADGIVFAPAGTNYQLHLKGTYAGPLDAPVLLLIRAEIRKLLTVPAGGNFVAPIFGTPRTLQGRVRLADTTHLVVHAGLPFLAKLPTADDAIDLNTGAIAVGHMVNLTLLGTPTFELVESPALTA